MAERDGEGRVVGSDITALRESLVQSRDALLPHVRIRVLWTHAQLRETGIVLAQVTRNLWTRPIVGLYRDDEGGG